MSSRDLTRHYRLAPGALVDAATWIEHTRDRWAARLDAFERHLDRQWKDDQWKDEP